MNASGRTPRALALVVILSVCLQAVVVSGANIVSGANYYLKLKKSPYCKSTAQYMGYNNKKCGENGPLLRTKNDGSMSWKRWVVAVKKKENSKSWLVQLTSTWDPKVTKPTCLGRMTVSKPDLCQSGTGVRDVKIVTTSPQQWRMVEVATNTFTISAANRAAGCLRFLGASGNCSAPAVKLFKSDDKSGAQRWILERVSTPKPSPKPPTPSPKPPTSKKAGQPTQVRTSAVSEDTWTASWVDGAAGVPVETYNLACVRPGAGCEAAPAAATDGISRGTGAGSVVGLAAGTSYDCYVIATNSAGFVCSAPVAVKTNSITPQDVKAGKPTAVSNTVSGTTWVATWTDGSAGTPVETYTAKCVAQGVACDSGATVGTTKTNVPRGTKAANVTNLPAGKFSCYIVAINSAGSTCSDPVTVDVTAGIAPGQPTGVSGTLQVTTWAAKWTDGSAGNPVETYTVKCVANGVACNGTAVGVAPSGIARGVQSGAAGPLPTGSSYSCYVIAINSVSAICSAPQTVTVGTVIGKPGKPTGVTLSARTATTVQLKWTVGTAGIPEEKYAVECVQWPNACGSTPLGTPAEGISRAVTNGTTTNLPLNTRMYCYAIAYNTNNLVDDVCSDPVDVPAATAGDIQAGIPTAVNFAYTAGTAQAVATWTPGTIGVPLETYEAYCVAFPGGPAAVKVGTPGGSTRLASIAYVTNLAGSLDLNCYVAAINTAGVTYSAPFRLLTAVTFPPGAPTAVTTIPGGVSQTSVTLSWTYGTQGTPIEDYQIRCYPTAGVAPACTSNVGVVTSASVSKTTLGLTPNLIINGLAQNTDYKCYVRASNVAGSACSASAFAVTTLSPVPVAPSQPGNPQLVSVSQTSATIQFPVSATPGVPVESYIVTCFDLSLAVPPTVTLPLTCNTSPTLPAVVGVAHPAVERTATSPMAVTFGPAGATALKINTQYQCFVGAFNSQTGGNMVCAQSSVSFFTNPQAPNPVNNFEVLTATITATSADLQWTPPATPGNPEEKYTVKCWATTSGVPPPGLNCQTTSPAPTFTSPLIPRAGPPTSFPLTGLTPFKFYHCTLGASNAATTLDVCGTTATLANFVTFQTDAVPPGDPGATSFALVDQTATTATFTYSLASPAGTPAEQYQILCYPLGTVLGDPALGCREPGAITSSPAVTRPTAEATITGLSSTASYDCYVLAFNEGSYPTPGFTNDFCSYYVAAPIQVVPL